MQRALMMPTTQMPSEACCRPGGKGAPTCTNSQSMSRVLIGSCVRVWRSGKCYPIAST